MKLSSIIHRAVCVTALITLSTLSVHADDAAAATPAAPVEPKSPWESSAAVGLTLTRGNSDTLMFTGSLAADKKKPKYEVSLGADFTYGENDDEKSNESLHGFGQYNYLFTDRFYGYVRLDGLHDAIADVEYRFTLSPGVGYYLVKQTNTTLSVEGGPGLVFEKTGDDTSTYLTLRLAEKFEHKFNEGKSRIWQSVEILPQVDDWDNYVVNAEIGVESALSKKASLRVYIQDTYDHQPADDRRKNDLKLVSALAYKF